MLHDVSHEAMKSGTAEITLLSKDADVLRRFAADHLH